MPSEHLPSKTIRISTNEARRFMLMHHGLYPPRKLKGKSGILQFIQNVGCIQFDPINIVGRNPDLVLQSRVKDYSPGMLDELLYQDRKLSDGWDKMASIYLIQDWPNFERHRHFIRTHQNSRRPTPDTLASVLEQINQRGPLSPLDFKDERKVDWYWAPTSAARAALEYLYSIGELGINHRINNRRYFDLIERLIPTDYMRQEDPFKTAQEYQEWHILRRIGGMGLVNTRAGEYWHGILDTKSPERNRIILQLFEQGLLALIDISDIPGNSPFFIRSQDLPTLEHSCIQPLKSSAAIIAPLDNLSWNRTMLKLIFDFDYTWEVYKPKSQRKYGYYVLPVLFNDQFVARFEPAFDKRKNIFTIQNWWWENNIEPSPTTQLALEDCFRDFLQYLGTNRLELGAVLKVDKSLAWAINLTC